jgi:hypothetical protein
MLLRTVVSSPSHRTINLGTKARGLNAGINFGSDFGPIFSLNIVGRRDGCGCAIIVGLGGGKGTWTSATSSTSSLGSSIVNRPACRTRLAI